MMYDEIKSINMVIDSAIGTKKLINLLKHSPLYDDPLALGTGKLEEEIALMEKTYTTQLHTIKIMQDKIDENMRNVGVEADEE